jgi:hypothetical protein
MVLLILFPRDIPQPYMTDMGYQMHYVNLSLIYSLRKYSLCVPDCFRWNSQLRPEAQNI